MEGAIWSECSICRLVEAIVIGETSKGSILRLVECKVVVDISKGTILRLVEYFDFPESSEVKLVKYVGCTNRMSAVILK